jgi:hypothetical protein
MSALGGTWLEKFDWTYEEAITTYRGVQNQALPGSVSGIPSLGTITIQYKVTRNTPAGDPSNGFNVNLQPPPYSNGFNATGDDVATSYTYVRATDFGDAPASYGSAGAEINLFTDVDGFYLNYVFLGASVDHEAADQPSAAASGDDGSGSDDEDGVSFPTLTAGATATVPVTLTVTDSDYSSGGRLNAWVDWNGDGDFADAGEKIANNILIAESETRNLTVTVPGTALTTRPTFARFRFGPNTGSTGVATYGEVEDYEISIQPKRVALGDRVWEDMNGNGAQEAGEPGLTNATVRLLDAASNVVATAVTSATGAYLFTNLPPAMYQVEFVAPAQYVFTVRDAAVTNDLADSDADLVTGRTAPVSVTAGTTNLTLDAGLNVPAVLHGYVFRDKNEDLLRSTGDSSLTNVRVRLLVGGVEVAATNSNEIGYYWFGGVPAGTVSVLVSRVGGTLTGVPSQAPDASDEDRNRALPDGPGVDAYIVHSVVSGQGVLADRPAETLNFGFVVRPLSTELDLSVYATGDGGVMIELWTSNESGSEDIVISAWLNGAWVEVARVPSWEIIGEGSNRYVVRAEGLAPDGAYLFKVLDEAGHEHISPLPIAVRTLRVGAVRLDMQTLTLAFNTEAGRPYVVKVSTDLVHWTTEYVSSPTAQGWSAYRNTPFTAGGESTQVRVPVNGRKQVFFKIVMTE